MRKTFSSKNAKKCEPNYKKVYFSNEDTNSYNVKRLREDTLK